MEGSHLVQRSENKSTETERKLLNAVDNHLENATEAEDLPQL